MKGNETQKVASAKTLFSASTEHAIKHLTNNDRAANLFLIVDSFFDKMNTKFPEPPNSKTLKAAFELEKNYNDQMTFLKCIQKFQNYE